jgi:hypothetical protein
MQIIYASQPEMNTTALFATFPRERVILEKKVIIESYMESATRISVLLRCAECSIGANIIPDGSECFKFDAKMKYNMGTGNHVNLNFFKLTKKQGAEAFEQHCKNLVKHVFGVKPEDDFTIIIWTTKAIRLINATCPKAQAA